MRSEDVAQKYSVSASWVYDLHKKRRETGSIAPKQQRHGSRPKLVPYEKEVRQRQGRMCGRFFDFAPTIILLEGVNESIFRSVGHDSSVSEKRSLTIAHT